jgi:CRP-like cAMP-binding protein
MDRGGYKPYTKTSITKLLDDAGFFQSFNPSQQEIFVNYLKAYEVPAQTRLMAENENNDTIFFLCAGSVDVYKQDASSKPVFIRNLELGSSIGEWSFFDHAPCFADVITATLSIVLTLDRNDFLELSKESPYCALAFALELFRSLTGKLRQANKELFLHAQS